MIETNGHYADGAFRANDGSEFGDDGSDMDAYNALNYRPTNKLTSADLSDMQMSEDFFSAAISGNENAQISSPGIAAAPAVALDDDARVGYALDACISLSSEDVDLINGSAVTASQADSSALDASAVSSLDKVAAAVQMNPARGSATPKAADGNPVRSRGPAATAAPSTRNAASAH